MIRFGVFAAFLLSVPLLATSRADDRPDISQTGQSSPSSLDMSLMQETTPPFHKRMIHDSRLLQRITKHFLVPRDRRSRTAQSLPQSNEPLLPSRLDLPSLARSTTGTDVVSAVHKLDPSDTSNTSALPQLSESDSIDLTIPDPPLDPIESIVAYVDRKRSFVRIDLNRNGEIAPVGLRMDVFHQSLFGLKYLGELEVVDSWPGKAFAKPVEDSGIRFDKIRRGDQVVYLGR